MKLMPLFLLLILGASTLAYAEVTIDPGVEVEMPGGGFVSFDSAQNCTSVELGTYAVLNGAVTDDGLLFTVLGFNSNITILVTVVESGLIVLNGTGPADVVVYTPGFACSVVVGASSWSQTGDATTARAPVGASRLDYFYTGGFMDGIWIWIVVGVGILFALMRRSR